MSTYCGYVVKVKELRKHTNADRLQIATFFGNDTVVSLDVQVGDLGVYFPTDGQLSEKFCEVNNLVRRKDDAGNNIGGFMDPVKRNVTTIRLRGEKSDGLYLPISCLALFGDISTLKEGDTISVFNGNEICQKYIPARKNKQNNNNGNHARKKKAPVAPLFMEHADTEQLAYNLNAFKPGDQIEITLKMHGTSQRTGYLPVLKGYKRTLLDRIFRREGTPIYDWGYVSGTRRTVLENYDGGYYGDNSFREEHSKMFEGKLWKGETVYYEVVGFTTNGTSIMGKCNNKKLNDKQFIKTYGETTVFSYGCTPTGTKTMWGRDEESVYSMDINVPQSDLYVYRMTMTNEDGNVVEYTPDFMRYRCEQMGVKCVPVFWVGTIPEYPASPEDNTVSAGEWVRDLAERFYDGPDPVGKTHIREGVVVRIINKPKFAAYKHKNFYFKCLEGIIKTDAVAPDMEEADELL